MIIPRVVMVQRVSQNVSLTPEHAAFIAALVASGRYGSTSEVVRAALRGLQDREAATVSPTTNGA